MTAKRSTIGSENRISPWGGSERRGARFASTGASPVRRGHGVRAEHYERSDSSYRLTFGLLVALGAVLVIAIGLVATRKETMSFNELLSRIGVRSATQTTFPAMSVNELLVRLGKPASKREMVDFVYLYYTVKEGTAEIVVDRGGWEVNEARIRRVALTPQ